jgi:hypothetical protein
MELLLSVLGYAALAALVAVSLGGFAASIAYAIVLFIGKKRSSGNSGSGTVR